MERLTQWIDDGERIHAVPCMELKNNGHQKCCDKLASYEDAEEQGLLVRLPCKVGQDVFTIISQRDNFSDQPYKIVSCISFRLELINKIGKTVFLTKEEAEAALERMG